MRERIETYKELWKQSIYNGNKNIVYIDIPFCLSKCSFCIFNPIVTREPNASIHNYLTGALSSSIDLYNGIFSMSIPTELFFGGGTPSLLSTTHIENIVYQLNNFNQIRVKAFEAHPESLTYDKLKKLISLGFNYFTLGIQSFDTDTLNKVHRKPVGVLHLKKQIEIIHSSGGIVSVDLIAYLKGWNKSNIYTTEQDLYILTEQVRPDIIVVHTNYKTYRQTPEELFALNAIIKNALDRTDYYVRDHSVFETNRVLEMGPYTYNLYQGNYSRICEHKQYDCSGPGNLNASQNVFSLGGLPERKIYSYIGDKCQWYQYYKGCELVIEQVPYNTLLH